MKGYRCDTCMDFRPPPQPGEPQSLFAAWTTSRSSSNGLPSGWVGVDDDGHDLHFCGPACLAAFAEAAIQAQANVVE